MMDPKQDVEEMWEAVLRYHDKAETACLHHHAAEGTSAELWVAFRGLTRSNAIIGAGLSEDSAKQDAYSKLPAAPSEAVENDEEHGEEFCDNCMCRIAWTKFDDDSDDGYWRHSESGGQACANHVTKAEPAARLRAPHPVAESVERKIYPFDFSNEQILSAVQNTEYAKAKISNHLIAMSSDQRMSLYRAIASLTAQPTPQPLDGASRCGCEQCEELAASGPEGAEFVAALYEQENSEPEPSAQPDALDMTSELAIWKSRALHWSRALQLMEEATSRKADEFIGAAMTSAPPDAEALEQAQFDAASRLDHMRGLIRTVKRRTSKFAVSVGLPEDAKYPEIIARAEANEFKLAALREVAKGLSDALGNLCMYHNSATYDVRRVALENARNALKTYSKESL